MRRYKFKATIEAAGAGACVLFPFDVQKAFGTGGQVPVKVSFDGVLYSGTMVTYGRPQHMLPLLKNIREKIGKGPGDVVDVVVERDETLRTVEVPPEFSKMMKKAGVLGFFEKLSYTHRKEYCRWITEAKKEETRANRLARSIEKLKAGTKTPG
jgi:hypothetical protein